MEKLYYILMLTVLVFASCTKEEQDLQYGNLIISLGGGVNMYEDGNILSKDANHGNDTVNLGTQAADWDIIITTSNGNELFRNDATGGAYHKESNSIVYEVSDFPLGSYRIAFTNYAVSALDSTTGLYEIEQDTRDEINMQYFISRKINLSVAGTQGNNYLSTLVAKPQLAQIQAFIEPGFEYNTIRFYNNFNTVVTAGEYYFIHPGEAPWSFSGFYNGETYAGSGVLDLEAGHSYKLYFVKGDNTNMTLTVSDDYDDGWTSVVEPE